MNTLTAKQLHNGTSKVLDSLEAGESFAVIRRGKRIGRLVPDNPRGDWNDVLAPVVAALGKVKTTQANPVLAERRRRRR